MATQQARNRRAGAEWETRLLHQLRDTGHNIERLHLNGKEDEGDLILTTGNHTYVIEAKAGQPHLAEFVKQASREARNYETCLLYTSPSPRDATLSRMPSSA